jgi:hypothetical protein
MLYDGDRSKETDVKSTSERIAEALGCEAYSDLAARVSLRMQVLERGPIDRLDHDDFEALAWLALKGVRKAAIARGEDDPAWDLRAPVPVSSDQQGGER